MNECTVKDKKSSYKGYVPRQNISYSFPGNLIIDFHMSSIYFGLIYSSYFFLFLQWKHYIQISGLLNHKK